MVFRCQEIKSCRRPPWKLALDSWALCLVKAVKLESEGNKMEAERVRQTGWFWFKMMLEKKEEGK